VRENNSEFLKTIITFILWPMNDKTKEALKKIGGKETKGEIIFREKDVSLQYQKERYNVRQRNVNLPVSPKRIQNSIHILWKRQFEFCDKIIEE
jgi:hypothetical protein